MTAETLIIKAMNYTLYCAFIAEDGTDFALDFLRNVIPMITMPVTSGHCPGTSVGIIVAENDINVVHFTSKSTDHFKSFIILVSGTLHSVLEHPSVFTYISAYVVAANFSSVFYLSSPQNQEFLPLKISDYIISKKLPNLQGRIVHAATFHCPPFSYFQDWAEEVHYGSFPLGIPDGVEMAVFRALAWRLNFTWKLKEIKGADKWGHRDSNGSWSGGILGTLSRKRADIGFCGIFVDETSVQVLDLTIPWTHYCLTFLVPLHASSFRFAILRTFHPLLWFAILTTTLGTTVIYCLLTHAKKEPQDLPKVLITAVGILSLSFIPEHDFRILRPLMISWSIYSLLMATALSSCLVSHLTRPPPAKQLNSVQDLVRAGITWGQDFKQEQTRLFNLKDPWHVQLAERFQLESSQCDRVARVRNGGYAILGGRLDGIAPYFMEGDTLKDTGLISQLHVMRECLIRHYSAIGLTKRSSLTEPVSRVLRWLLETGLVEHWQADLVRNYGNPEIKNLFHDFGYKGPQKLTWTHLEDIFLLLSIGLGISTVIFCLEYCWFTVKSMEILKVSK
ncbi:Ionotropic receptor 101 [Blattella germanica]|nr:Ionotropic receptor 101 [Blattella germanica]